MGYRLGMMILGLIYTSELRNHPLRRNDKIVDIT